MRHATSPGPSASIRWSISDRSWSGWGRFASQSDHWLSQRPPVGVAARSDERHRLPSPAAGHPGLLQPSEAPRCVTLGDIIVDNADDRSRVVQDVARLLCGIGGVDRHHDRPDRHRPQVGQGPLVAGRGEDRDAIARLHAEPQQAGRHTEDRGLQLAPAGLLPGAPVLVDRRRGVRVGVDTLLEEGE